MQIQSPNQILLSKRRKEEILAHCRRKLEGCYVDGEAQGKKAYGLVGGGHTSQLFEVKECIPLLRNHRNKKPFKSYMDKIIEEHAIRSVTPFAQRGWVADPLELLDHVKNLRQKGLHLIGTYHMHRVAWENDPRRDTPTRLDALLAARSGLFTFIISMVDPLQPVIRAFHEGNPVSELIILETE